MDILISNTSGEPIYQQITDQIKKLIVKGEIPEGAILPSIRQLAKDLRLSVITTKRAYEDLEREGFIATVPGKGSFVAPCNYEIIRENQLKIIEEKIKDVVRESKLANLTLDELIKVIRVIHAEEQD